MLVKIPVFQQNFLACYPFVLQRLQSIDGVKAVKEVQELENLTDEYGAVAPLDGVIYVIIDSINPLSYADNGRSQAVEIGFTFVLVKAIRTAQPHILQMGEMITKIAQSMQGYEPLNEHGERLTTSAFIQRQAMNFRYERGFGFYPMRFTTQVAFIANGGDE